MRSKAHVGGHPIHPMLIPFPIAFLTGALGFDVAGRFLNKSDLYTVGGYLLVLGILFAFATAIPGIVDYYAVVPPKSKGKQDAARHGIVNSVALVLFIIAASLRHGWHLAPTTTVLVLETLACLILGYGGWLGGEVAYIDHIGMGTYYPNSREWDETYVTAQTEGTVVSEAEDLEVDQMKLIHVAGKRIVLIRNADGYSAVDDRCPHQGGSLADGAAVCGTVQCPWHGSQFDTQSGAVKKGPAKTSVQAYRVEAKNGKILLHLNTK